MLKLSKTPMISKGVRSLLIVALILQMLSGCASQPVAEPPICVPVRDFFLEEISVEEQRSIFAIDPDILRRLAENDLRLKSHVVVLERTIEAHDEPLGDCD